jgi:hypothetical protein
VCIKIEKRKISGISKLVITLPLKGAHTCKHFKVSLLAGDGGIHFLGDAIHLGAIHNIRAANKYHVFEVGISPYIMEKCRSDIARFRIENQTGEQLPDSSHISVKAVCDVCTPGADLPSSGRYPIFGETYGKAVGKICVSDLPKGITVDLIRYDISWVIFSDKAEVKVSDAELGNVAPLKYSYSYPLDTKVGVIMNQVKFNLESPQKPIPEEVRDWVGKALSLLGDATGRFNAAIHRCDPMTPLFDEVGKTAQELSAVWKKVLRLYYRGITP